MKKKPHHTFDRMCISGALQDLEMMHIDYKGVIDKKKFELIKNQLRKWEKRLIKINGEE